MHTAPHSTLHPMIGSSPTTARDPVCGMTVDPSSAKHDHHHEGVRYFFCSARCKEKFEGDPAKYVEPKHAAHATTTDAASHAHDRCPGPRGRYSDGSQVTEKTAELEWLTLPTRSLRGRVG